MKRSTTTLIERIYEAAIYPQRWDAVFLDLAACFNSETAGMWVYCEDAASPVSRMVGAIDDAEMAFYNRHLAAQNPWYQIPGLMRPGCALTDTSIEVIRQDPRAFTRTAFYQEWIKHLGLRHVLGGTLADTAGRHLNFTFLRSARAGAYREREVAAFRRLSCHVAKSVELSGQIEAHRWTHELAEASLNRLGIGVVIVDAARRLLFANFKGEALLRARSGIVLRDHHLCAADPQYQEELERAIGLLAGGGGHARIDIRESTAPMTLHLSSHLQTASFLSTAKRAVTLFVIDASPGPPSRIARFKQLWKLSNKEAQFADLLLRGLTVKEAAERLDMTFETARWYCKQAMHKIGVNKQSQLIATLLSDVLVSGGTDVSEWA
jgi:DNA-binding CsgD family transcriptional regulator